MQKFGRLTGSTGRSPQSLRVGIFATAFTIVAIVALAATPRKELATRGLDFTADVLVERAVAGDLESVKLFLAAGMDVDVVTRGAGAWGVAGSRSTALLAASSVGHAEIVSYLVEKGAAVDKKDVQDQTPLMAAAIAGHTEIVAFLAVSGADVNAKSAYGQTPLIFAVTSGSGEAARILLGWGAMVNARDDITGGTALDRANHPELIRLLRAAGGKKASEL